MKKYIIIVLMFALLFNMALPVQATSEEYEIPEMGLSLTIPTEYFVFTRDMDENDQLFSELGISKDDMMEQFVSGNIFLNAVVPGVNEEIVVTMTENTIETFDGLGDMVLMTLASAFESEFLNYGISVLSYDIYHHSQLNFIRVYFSSADKSVYGLQYYTIYGNKAMNFTMRSYDGPVSEEQENTIQSIVDSIYLESYKPVNSAVEETPAFVYTDAESGLEFTVPANWKQEEVAEENEFIDTAFTSVNDPGLMMMYGSADLWSQMLTSERMGYVRSDIDNTFLTPSDVAEMLGTSEPVNCVDYNGREYFRVELVTETEVYGMNLSITMTHIIRIENGWMYWFQFSGNSAHECFGDFEELISNIHYPETHAEEYPESQTETDLEKNAGGSLLPVMILIGINAAIVILVFARKKKRRAAAQKNTAIPQDDPISCMNEDYVFCHMCGEKLPKDSRFCHKCGTKIMEEECNT